MNEKMITLFTILTIFFTVGAAISGGFWRHYSGKVAKERETRASLERDSIAKSAEAKRDSMEKQASLERNNFAKEVKDNQSKIDNKVNNYKKTLDKISSENDRIKENTEISRREAEINKFFRENNFSIVNRYFNPEHGYRITRQLKSGDGFSKVIIGSKSRIYENLTDELVFNVGDDKRVQVRRNGAIALPDFDSTIASMSVQGGSVSLDSHNFFRPQDSGGIKINNDCDLFILLQKDDNGYTFAVGRGPCP